MTITFPQTEVRASEMARGCERMSVLRALGYESAQHDSETLEWFARGNLFEEYVVRQLEAKHGRDNVRRQVHIQHPLGVGHADALIIAERLLVEVKSTQTGNLTTPAFENGVNQLRIYLRFCDDADEGALYMINPSTLRPAEVFRVVLTDEDIEEIDATITRLNVSIQEKFLPARVCRKPGDARGMMCSFADACFEGWEPPPTMTVEDPEAVDVAAQVISLAAQERPHKEALAELNAKRKELQAELGEYVDYGEYQVGGFTVKRWRVNGKRSVSAKAMEAAGFDTAPFATLSEGHDRYEVRLNDAEFIPDATDFGQAPF